ncbi:MAG: PRC-barrel domain-containing protein [Halobacteriota archaeon]
MTHGIVDKEVSTQSGADIGKVKDVIIDLATKDVSIEVSKGMLKGEMTIPMSKIIDIGDRVIVADDVAQGFV